MASVVAAQTWPGHHDLSARWTRNVASIPKRVLCLANAQIEADRPESLLGLKRPGRRTLTSSTEKRAQTVAYVRKAMPDPPQLSSFPGRLSPRATSTMSRRSYGKGATPKPDQPARALPGTLCSTLAGHQAQSQLGSRNGHSPNRPATPPVTGRMGSSRRA